MTTQEAVTLGIPRWMVLAMPEDVAQEYALSRLMGRTEAQRREALKYRLRTLRYEVWNLSGRQGKAPKMPSSLQPSKLSRITGYRTDPVAHQAARLKVDPVLRREIAAKGAINVHTRTARHSA